MKKRITNIIIKSIDEMILEIVTMIENIDDIEAEVMIIDLIIMKKKIKNDAIDINHREKKNSENDFYASGKSSSTIVSH
jgi:hypothetical protein